MELADFLFFLEVLIGGLLSGIMYSLVALGLVLIFKASSIFNFAQGALVLFGALTFVLLTEVAGDFWMWTGWLAIGLAGASAVMYFLYQSQQKGESSIKEFADKYLKRVPLFVAAVVLLVLAFFVDGGQNMWAGRVCHDAAVPDADHRGSIAQVGSRRFAGIGRGCLDYRWSRHLSRLCGDAGCGDWPCDGNRKNRASPHGQPGTDHSFHGHDWLELRH